ncbi:MAG TPA: DOMON-like domain-containing protein [Caulobacteraceae bacterium]|nr:DOMON-like domain-containing protein [Caulobacteraceae bacterium]
MIRRLVPHPATPCDAVQRIEVDAARPSPGRLRLTYTLSGAIRDLTIPSVGQSTRADELWRTTCFETFVRPGGVEGYVELNLAPSTAWAAYVFDSYRDGMRDAQIAAPAISVNAADDRLELRAEVDFSPVPDVAGAPWRLAISAVIEETSGRKSYWALAHPPDRPDFHAPAGFVLELP